MMTVQEFKISAIRQLKKTSVSPILDVNVLLQHVLKCDKVFLLKNSTMELDGENLKWLNDAVQKRSSGLPVAYITGVKEFYGYDFKVNPDVLIPKPDTEILVERGLEIILEKIENRHKGEGNEGSLLYVCDMCTGSGCIGISVIKQLVEEYNVPYENLPVFIFADISLAALSVAQENAKMLLHESGSYSLLKTKLRFVQSNLFEIIPYDFDVILTNPPYIPSSLVDELLKDGRHEPRLALDGDVSQNGDRALTDDGLALIRRLIPQCKAHLSPFGTVLMEVGEYNAVAAAEFGKSFGFKTEILKDLEGQLRVVELS